MNIGDLKLETHDYNNIYKNPSLMCRLRDLTLHTDSGMNYELNSLSRMASLRQVDCRVLTASHVSEVLGWALLSRERSNFCFPRQFGYDPEDGVLFEVFVDPRHRRKGIGSELLKLGAKKASPHPLCIVPHDVCSQAFYENFEHYYHKKI